MPIIVVLEPMPIRFGGERVCDNQQIRTDRLDDLVWQQVVELLAHPGRLKTEYERRLGVL